MNQLYNAEKLPFCRCLNVVKGVSNYVFTKPPHHTDSIRHKVNVKRGLTGVDPEFFFAKNGCLTKAEESSMSHCVFAAEERIIWFILVQCEMQSVSARI